MVLILPVGEHADKDLLVGVTLGVVHQANVTTGIHELGGRSDLERSVVNAARVFHLGGRFENLKAQGGMTLTPSDPLHFRCRRKEALHAFMGLQQLEVAKKVFIHLPRRCSRRRRWSCSDR
jgi:hypothetical protein